MDARILAVQGPCPAAPLLQHSRGAINNHVGKKGWVGGLKFAIFVHFYCIKNVHEGYSRVSNKRAARFILITLDFVVTSITI